MQDFFDLIYNRFTFPEYGERSMEVDPRSVQPEDLDQLLANNINRISFGVQDLEPVVQAKIKRRLEPEHLENLMAHLRKSGFDSINIDLMYGLPGQSSASFTRTIEKVVKLRPFRIAIFGYAHVPWMCKHQKALEKYHLPSPEERTALFGLAWDRLVSAGYSHVGMDHFALPDDALIQALKTRSLTRNFMGYTTHRGLDLMGIGASAISSVGPTYTQNVKTVDEYLRAAGNSTWFKGLILHPEDLLRREIILELFCNFHLDIAAMESNFKITFADHFSEEIKRLAPFESDGMITLSGDTLEVSALGRFFIRNICMVFDEYLKPGKGLSRYSKTI